MPKLVPALRYGLSLLACALAVSACGTGNQEATVAPLQEEAQAFLDSYTDRYGQLYAAASEAEWQANIRIVEGDDTNRLLAEKAQQAQAEFTGSPENIEAAQRFLADRDALTQLQVRQLEQILYDAANFPQTVKEVVDERIASEALQNEKLYGFDFQVDGTSVSANEIDDRLDSSLDIEDRRKVWEASKEVGKELKEGLEEMVSLRNRTVQALGFDNYFHYQVADYGMSSEEMMSSLEQFVRELWPLYRELHTWARYELAERYGEAEVPDLLPAHWLPNRWGQDWASLVKVEGLDLDPVLADKEPEWLVRQGEEFFVSLGFDPLPESFYEKSSLYPAPPDAEYKKNNHASAWHMDLENDLRSLMSVQPNARWWATSHHELGHIYYYQAYSTPEVPLLLRGGANRAFHEAVGTMLGMAATHKSFLEGRGLVPEGLETDETQALLREALDSVVFIPFSAGTMSHFEHDLYTGKISKDEYNRRWWDYALQYQGISPPGERGEEFCDACTKTHIINDAAQYYDYALSQVILYQLHTHIAEKILGQDPRNTNYFGSRQVGDFLRSLLAKGATEDWRKLMKETLGEEISANAMLAYFDPLMEYLKTENAGRSYTLPDFSG